MSKEPLFPHVSKSRKKGTNAWRCKQCGWTTWNVTKCPKCGSSDLEELTSEEVTQFYSTGKPVIHPRGEEPDTKEAVPQPFSPSERTDLQHMLNYIDDATKRLQTVQGMLDEIIFPKDPRAKGVGMLFPAVYDRIEHIKDDIEDIAQGKPFRHG